MPKVHQIVGQEEKGGERKKLRERSYIGRGKRDRMKTARRRGLKCCQLSKGI